MLVSHIVNHVPQVINEVTDRGRGVKDNMVDDDESFLQGSILTDEMEDPKETSYGSDLSDVDCDIDMEPLAY